MDKKEIRTDTDGLAKLVDLPEHVQSVRWRSVRSRGNASLVAVMRIEQNSLDDLLRHASYLDVQSPLRITQEVADLFSETRGDAGTSGPSELRGVSIDPRPFVNRHKSGLLNGIAVIAADQGLVYLRLYEM